MMKVVKGGGRKGEGKLSAARLAVVPGANPDCLLGRRSLGPQAGTFAEPKRSPGGKGSQGSARLNIRFK